MENAKTIVRRRWSVSPTQISLNDSGILLDRCRRTFRNFLTEIEHDDSLRNIHHETHIMFNQEDRDLLQLMNRQNEARHILFLFGVHSRHGLVEEQERRFQCQGPAEFDALPHAVAEITHDGFADGFHL